MIKTEAVEESSRSVCRKETKVKSVFGVSLGLAHGLGSLKLRVRVPQGSSPQNIGGPNNIKPQEL